MKPSLIFPACILLLAACNRGGVDGAAAQKAQGHYADGFNALLKVNDVIKRYARDIPEAGPTKAVKLFPEHRSAQGEVAKARTAFQQAESAAPKDLAHLAPLAKAAQTHADATVSTFAEAFAYYDAENWKDDQFAKGKALHGRMVQHISAYRAAMNALSSALTQVEDIQARKELAKYEAKKDASYWFRAGLMDAKAALNQVEREPAKDGAERFERALDKLTATKSGVDAIQLQVGTWPAFKQSFERFQAAAIRMNRVLKAGVATPAQTETFEREREAMVSSYNTLVSLHDALQQLEQAKALK